MRGEKRQKRKSNENTNNKLLTLGTADDAPLSPSGGSSSMARSSCIGVTTRLDSSGVNWDRLVFGLAAVDCPDDIDGICP